MPDISIGRLRGGFCVYWTANGQRKRYQLEARTREEAEAEGRTRYTRETTSIKGLTTNDIWRAYLDCLGEKPTATTMKYTGKAVLKHFGNLRPDQITVEDCRSYRVLRQDAGRAVGSVHTELGHLRSALKWARKSNLIEQVPHIEMPPKPDSNVIPLTDSEIRALIDGCAAAHIRLADILLFATGARVGAVLDLTWERVDFELGVINLRLPDGVTRKGRAVVPMNRMARVALETAYHGRLTENVVEWAGKPVKSIRKGYTAAIARAGLKNVNIHQIRHSVAVRLLQSGQPIEVVSQFLGHSNSQITTKTYARFIPGHLVDAANVVDFDFVRGVK